MVKARMEAEAQRRAEVEAAVAARRLTQEAPKRFDVGYHASARTAAKTTADAQGPRAPFKADAFVIPKRPVAAKVPPRRLSAIEHERIRYAYLGDKWMIDPRTSKFMPVWDIIIFVALAFTATVTPMEVTFIDEGPCITGLFVFNRILDIIFVADIAVQSMMCVQDSNGMWIRDRSLIMCHYAKGWLVIDVASVAPFWLQEYLEGEGVECPFVPVHLREAASGATGIAAPNLQSVRVIRLMRLLKLARILKASRVLKRLVADLLMTKLEFTYGTIKAISLFFLLLWVSHMLACIFAYVSIDAADAGEPSWVGTFRDSERAVHGREVSAGGLYVGALYWSMMTITSIGYGDITPKNDTERAVCCLLMMISGATWAFVIAEAAGIAATLDPNGAAFRNSMDALNVYMKERKLDKEMRHMMRDFFVDARAVNQAESDGSLLSQLSPMLQGKVALAASADWLKQVWFLRSLGDSRVERDFIAAMSKSMRVLAFAVNERIPLGEVIDCHLSVCHTLTMCHNVHMLMAFLNAC